MSEYTPDKWVIVKIIDKGKKEIYKVFGSWKGGYLSGDSWRINSGIIKASLDGKMFNFLGATGSQYHCHKSFYGTTVVTAGVLEGILKQAGDQGIYMRTLTEKEAFSLDWIK